MNFFRFVNSFPLSFTSTHYQVFEGVTEHLKEGKVDSPESWDELREHHEHFSIGHTREEWLKAAEGVVKKDGQDGGMKQRALDVVSELQNLNARALFSVGVGGAGLEYQIKKHVPALHVTCSEYAPRNVEMLKKVFTECEECVVFDILHSEWTPALREGSITLMYRVDPHFTDNEWRSIFERMHHAGVAQIIFIPCTCLSIKSWLFRLQRRLGWFMSRTPVAFAGYVRTQKRFETFWKGLYTSSVREYGGLRGFTLSIDKINT